MKKLLCVGLLLSSGAWADSLILTTEDAPPFNYSTDSGKTIVGSATEVVRELFKRAEIDYTLKMYPWVRAIEMAHYDKNTCVYSTTRTEEREKSFLWVGPVAPNDWVLFAKADSTITLDSLEAARAFKIGGYRGDAITLYLQGQKFAIDEAGNDEQSVQKLNAGRIDLWATGISAGPFVSAKMKVKVKPLLSFKKTELYLACNTSVAAATIDKLNATLQTMVKDGTIDTINKKYQ
ncbi:MAG: ABC transporter substrate-binding protein [Pseudomonas sp.]|uniref:substrate-binding periplasmic protein n=1 Tax=Pseudomonas sp. TaxID=306 RepID=UPI002735A2E6|nr:ABC transporter substrate-binding protein [Pseudomonas sp.]MDP3847168.1 ABC transporter substrate-binding protein [Pseudomonas sp.]